MILVRRLRLIAEEFPLVELVLGLFGRAGFNSETGAPSGP
jgi:hypothetical protein